MPNLAKQTAQRTSAIFIVKLLGFIARIPLFRMIGPEGIGLYQMAYSVYGLAVSLIAGGFPTALALAASKNPRQGARLYRLLWLPMLALGVLAAALCYAGAPFLAVQFGNPTLAFALQCMSPALAAVPLLGLLRGYLQGKEEYGRIALSEVVEQSTRVLTMLLFAALMLHMGLAAAVGGAVLGAFSGAAAALFFLLSSQLLRSKSSYEARPLTDWNQPDTPSRETIRFFLISSAAIFATRLIVPLSDFLDAVLIPNRLQAGGMTVSQATSVFGEISGMAATIVYMPTLVTSALAFTLSTKLAADWKSRQKERFLSRSRSVLEFGFLWGFGSFLFLLLYADPLSRLLFDTATAAGAIRCLALAPLFSGLRELTTTMLWAAEKRKAPLAGLILGVLCSVAFVYTLTPLPGFGIAGACLGFLALEACGLLWNLRVLVRLLVGKIAYFHELPALCLQMSFLFVTAIACRHLTEMLPFHGLWWTLAKMAITFGGLLLLILIRTVRPKSA